MLPHELEIRLEHIVEYSDETRDLAALARRFITDPVGFLTVWGPYGNGKTLILQSIVNEFRIQHGVIGSYVRLYDLIEYIRAGFDDGSDSSARQRYLQMRCVPLLAIDECDGPRFTAFAEEFRRVFLDDRYRMAIGGNAYTILAMNTDPATLPGDIYDRLRDGRFIIHHNTAPSMRPAL